MCCDLSKVLWDAEFIQIQKIIWKSWFHILSLSWFHSQTDRNRSGHLWSSSGKRKVLFPILQRTSSQSKTNENGPPSRPSTRLWKSSNSEVSNENKIVFDLMFQNTKFKGFPAKSGPKIFYICFFTFLCWSWFMIHHQRALQLTQLIHLKTHENRENLKRFVSLIVSSFFLVPFEQNIHPNIIFIVCF